MPSKRKQTDGNSPVPGSDKIQTPLQIAQRKKKKAVLHQTKGGTPGDSSGSTDTTLRARKKHRMIAYNRSLKDLNDSFAAFAKAEEEKIKRQLEAGKVEEVDYSEACLKYMREAKEIHDRYFPPSGDVLAMGTNEFGQTGHGENVSSRMRPAVINTLHNANTIQAAAGGLHSLSVNMRGVVSSWGANDDGALGVYKESDLQYPADVKGFVPSALEEAQYLTPAQYTWSDLAATPTNKTKYSDADKLETKYQEKIDGVDAGDCHSLALSSTGRVYFWGSYKDTEGKAWRDCPPADDPRVHPNPEKRSKAPGGSQNWPMHVTKLKGEAIQISCGCSINAAIVLQKNEEGDTNPKQVLLTWGLGENGELARPVFGPLKKTEDEINALPEDAPSSAKYHVDKLMSDYLIPKPATFADGLKSRLVEKVVCGGYHILVIARDSNDGEGAMRIYSSGLNNYGQLGLGDSGTARHALTKIPSLAHEEISMAAAGEHHSQCLDSSGTKLYAFGRSDSGQCGHVDPVPNAGEFESTPVPIYLDHSNSDPALAKKNPIITRISCGGAHSFALTQNGALYTWGYAFNGACGIGKPNASECVTLPMKVNPVAGVNKLRAKEGKPKLKCVGIHSAVGGGQHSIMLATLQEK